MGQLAAFGTSVTAAHMTRPGDGLSRLGARLTVLGGALLAFVLLSGHIGTNQVVFEGQAGGYPVRVLINPPGVVPAQVPITVRVLSGTPSRVTVRAAQWNVGTKGAPPAEDAVMVPGDSGVWAHDLWIMTASIYAVYVAVEGPAGSGTVVVPMQTSATRTLGMERGMGAVLIALGTLLVAGMLTIIGAAVREGPVAPGQSPPPARVRGGRVANLELDRGARLDRLGQRRRRVLLLQLPAADKALARVARNVVAEIDDRDREVADARVRQARPQRLRRLRIKHSVQQNLRPVFLQLFLAVCCLSRLLPTSAAVTVCPISVNTILPTIEFNRTSHRRCIPEFVKLIFTEPAFVALILI